MNTGVIRECEEGADIFTDGFTCKRVNGKRIVKTPFRLPDHDYINIHLEPDGKITDGAETYFWLRSWGLDDGVKRVIRRAASDARLEAENGKFVVDEFDATSVGKMIHAVFTAIRKGTGKLEKQDTEGNFDRRVVDELRKKDLNPGSVTYETAGGPVVLNHVLTRGDRQLSLFPASTKRDFSAKLARIHFKLARIKDSVTGSNLRSLLLLDEYPEGQKDEIEWMKLSSGMHVRVWGSADEAAAQIRSLLGAA